MNNFLSVQDAPNIESLVETSRHYKKAPLFDRQTGEGKTLGLIFMNPSLRTRLSTQKAAQNLGMQVLMMNFTGEGWALETEEGVIMDGDKAEHIKDAAAVIGMYCDCVGLRSFPSLTNRELDYSESVLNAFARYAGIPVINLESATRHPLQSLTDILTIEELKKQSRPKVVMTWAPHVKALPQSVPNSFAEWINQTDYEFVITHPRGFELPEAFAGQAKVVYDQREAFEGADFIYAKNWSSYDDYGKIGTGLEHWMVDMHKMKLTNDAYFMHCLPVRRNLVVADEVLDSDQAAIIQQAGNRVWAAQAVLKSILSSKS